MRDHDLIDLLNGLIETTTDDMRCHESCAQHAVADELKQRFERRGSALRSDIAELNELLAQRGGSPTVHGTARGAMHRAMTLLRETVGYVSDADLLYECERAEATAMARHRRALTSPQLSETAVHDVLNRQVEALQRHHDELHRTRMKMAPAET